jgi:hypothetical protein
MVRRMVRPALAGAAAALLLAPAAAPAKPKPEPKAQPWATVNVCDTPAHPDAIGVRASMPPLGRKGERMSMRILVQWRSAVGWRLIGEGGDSGRIELGRARGQIHETGRLFRFEAPPEGQTQQLRGMVRFAWTARGRVVRTRTEVTEGGHRSSAGSDPKGFSAASCELAGD